MWEESGISQHIHQVTHCQTICWVALRRRINPGRLDQCDHISSRRQREILVDTAGAEFWKLLREIERWISGL